MEANSPLSMGSPSSNGPLKKLEMSLDNLFKKLPALPANVREAIAQYGPYVIAVLAILSVFGILALFGLGGIFVATLPYTGAYFWLSLIFSGVSLALVLMSLTGLFKRTRKSWEFLFLSYVVQTIGGIVLALVSMSPYFIGAALYSILWTLIGSAIAFYLLFQVKDYFNK
jgi:hypothetical protein